MIIKIIVKKLLYYFITSGIFILEKTKIYNFVRNISTNYNSKKINHVRIIKNKKLLFYVPNNLTDYRVKTFFSKEPDTIKWINSFKKNSLFLDIGSNIGLYSCYAAKIKNCNVISVEPSVFNLSLLAKNIFINNLQKKINILSNPLSDKLSKSDFNMIDISQGSALSSFSKLKTFNGKNIKANFSYLTFGITLDYFFKLYKLKHPDYIKIDVDGIEHLILKGGSKSMKKCKSILIEINTTFRKQYNYIQNFMIKNNFKLLKQTRLVDSKNSEFYNSFNQIWINKSLKNEKTKIN